MQRASIREVAALAGVSPKTVSNVLRGRAGEASVTTRDRVLQAARELSYVPVQVSLQNRKVETKILSLVFDHSGYWEGVCGWNYVDMLAFNGARQTALEKGYDVLIHQRGMPNWVAEREETWLLDRRSDGFLFVNPHQPERTNALMSLLVRHGIPAVACFDNQVPEGAASVLMDNVALVASAVDHLVSRGHHRIVHLLGPHHHAETPLRRDGYLRGMDAHGLSALAQIFDVSHDGSRVDIAIGEIIAAYQAGMASAVVCWDDGVALDLWKGLDSAGLSVPEDISIIGFNDCPEAAGKGLTTLTNDVSSIGAAGAEALIRLIKGANPQECNRLLPGKLVERDSVADLEPSLILQATSGAAL